MPRTKILLLLIMMISSLSAVGERQSGNPDPLPLISSVSVASPDLLLPEGTTFTWHENGQEIHADDRLKNANFKEMIDSGIENTLVSSGYKFVDPKEGAKYQIAYTAALEKDLTDRDILSRFGLLPGYPAIHSEQTRFERGSLIIYLVDPSHRTVVWRSATQSAVDFKADNESRKQRITRIIHEMLETLPRSR
ncbi:MAG: DUF4136 domain-containing protein [Candidatus Thiodiazotropha sp. (ex Monitilora ramsayi)]|nr:DUF4136 domain-containing protein [Candidatus Thiodiazotropha sp. (ex Monitilora ramsayi)]